jgi:hypothetical protein
MRQILWKQLLAALMFVTFLAPVIAQKSAETPVAATPDFSKEAYTIERLTSRITAESDGTGSREVTRRGQDSCGCRCESLRRSEFHLHQRE